MGGDKAKAQAKQQQPPQDPAGSDKKKKPRGGYFGAPAGPAYLVASSTFSRRGAFLGG